MFDGWITIRTFSSHIDAELAKTLLGSQGIQAMIEADDAGGILHYLTLSRGVRLLA